MKNVVLGNQDISFKKFMIVLFENLKFLKWRLKQLKDYPLYVSLHNTITKWHVCMCAVNSSDLHGLRVLTIKVRNVS